MKKYSKKTKSSTVHISYKKFDAKEESYPLSIKRGLKNGVWVTNDFQRGIRLKGGRKIIVSDTLKSQAKTVVRSSKISSSKKYLVKGWVRRETGQYKGSVATYRVDPKGNEFSQIPKTKNPPPPKKG